MPALKKIICRSLLIVMLGSGKCTYAQTPAVSEYQVKAVFLFRFTQFVSWPHSSLDSTGSPFIIGVFGANPFNSYLAEAVAGENVHGHPILIRQINKIDGVHTCHILYINQEDEGVTAKIIESTKGESILTVSDAPDFLEKGGMVRFVTKNNKTQIQMNLGAVSAAKLDVSSKLLRLVEIYASQ